MSAKGCTRASVCDSMPAAAGVRGPGRAACLHGAKRRASASICILCALCCRWDPLTKEIFQYVRSKGVATFSQIDAHIKATAAKQIAGGLGPGVTRGVPGVSC